MPRNDSHRNFVRRSLHAGLALCLAGLSELMGAPVLATDAASGAVVVIQDDRGGAVLDRALTIQRYRQAGTRIEIRGQFCMSACTMYLVMENTCISPATVFGFHGPSSPLFGIALSPELFETSSQLMAEHYPEPIRSWFLERGRHRTVGFHRYEGTALIELGIARCPGATTSS